MPVSAVRHLGRPLVLNPSSSLAPARVVMATGWPSASSKIFSDFSWRRAGVTLYQDGNGGYMSADSLEVVIDFSVKSTLDSIQIGYLGIEVCKATLSSDMSSRRTSKSDTVAADPDCSPAMFSS